MKKESRFLNVMKFSTILLSTCSMSALAFPANLPNSNGNIGEDGTVASQMTSQSEVLVGYNHENRFDVVQQGHQINGVVIDKNGEPIIGANIMEKGTSNGTITDFDGKFTLNVSNKATLVISYIGYTTQEIAASKATGGTLTVTLVEDTEMMDEVVVVGYGTMRKSDVTGSIASTRGSDILKTQSFSALDGLKGKASGVNIFSNSGQPGAGIRVLIRGVNTINASTDPLYVVDGVVMEDFHLLNPNDIENIEVLKDASSAAIYGARGANGVILVTTKRGKTDGEGVAVSYQGSVSFGTMARYMETLTASQWQEAFMQGLENSNTYHGTNYSLDRADHFTDPRYFDEMVMPFTILIGREKLLVLLYHIIIS